VQQMAIHLLVLDARGSSVVLPFAASRAAIPNHVSREGAKSAKLDPGRFELISVTGLWTRLITACLRPRVGGRNAVLCFGF